ncbi:MAG: hypothetical protein AB8G22_22335 [Saprospiraceae bacterium]
MRTDFFLLYLQIDGNYIPVYNIHHFKTKLSTFAHCSTPNILGSLTIHVKESVGNCFQRYPTVASSNNFMSDTRLVKKQYFI